MKSRINKMHVIGFFNEGVFGRIVVLTRANSLSILFRLPESFFFGEILVDDFFLFFSQGVFDDFKVFGLFLLC